MDCIDCGIACTGKFKRCRNCKLLQKKKYRLENLDAVKAGQRAHYLRNREEIKRKSKEWSLNNPEKVKSRNIRYYEENKDRIRTVINKWQSKNIEKVKEMQRVNCLNRVARVKGSEGKHKIEDIRKLYDDQNGLCNFCKSSILSEYHVDHIIPISRGGSNWPDNLQLLCPACNCQKHAMTMDEFIKRKRHDRTERNHY